MFVSVEGAGGEIDVKVLDERGKGYFKADRRRGDKRKEESHVFELSELGNSREISERTEKQRYI